MEQGKRAECLILDCSGLTVIGNEMCDHGRVRGCNKLKGKITGGEEVKEPRGQIARILQGSPLHMLKSQIVLTRVALKRIKEENWHLKSI